MCKLHERSGEGSSKLFFGGRDQRITEANSCKYFGIILRSDLSWADQINYTVRKAWKAFPFVMRVL